MGIITKEGKCRRKKKMKAETRKRANLISDKLLQRYSKNNKRNNTNSVGRYDCSITDTSRNNNKFSVQ